MRILTLFIILCLGHSCSTTENYKRSPSGLFSHSGHPKTARDYTTTTIIQCRSKSSFGNSPLIIDFGQRIISIDRIEYQFTEYNLSKDPMNDTSTMSFIWVKDYGFDGLVFSFQINNKKPNEIKVIAPDSYEGYIFNCNILDY